MRFALLACFMLSLAGGSSVAHAEKYALKDKDSSTGTRLKRDIAYLTFPPDKVYADLSATDKARIRALYEQMGPDDEPPYPAHGYGALMRDMAAIQGKLHVEGTVELGVMVGPDGKATEVAVYRATDTRLAQVLANLLILEKYKPALCHGAPCTQEFPFHARFTLSN